MYKRQGGSGEPLGAAGGASLRFASILFALVLFVELSIAVLGTALASIDSEGPTIPLGFGSPSDIGTLFLERFLIVFEAASLLLLVAAIGAIVLAGKRKEEAEAQP